MRFPQPFIDEIYAAADIVAVVSDYVTLRKAGTSYKGLCPFHSEKSPSFTVHRDRGFFHCFGCGAGGDVFKFVELQEKVGFTDAVKQLAARFGVPIPELEESDEGRESAAEREALLRAHEVAAAYFREQLGSPAGARIRQYLLGDRGLTPETIETLGMGYAPPARKGCASGCSRSAAPAAPAQRDDGAEVDRFATGDDPDYARHRLGDCVRRPRAGGPGSSTELAETPVYWKGRTPTA
jgi:DNA primase